jgi:hypothetical protein
MDLQEHVSEFVELLQTLVFSQECGSYFTAEFIGNGHGSPEGKFRVLR